MSTPTTPANVPDERVLLEGNSPGPRIPDYELLRRIGRGSYGEVWLGRSVTGAYRAVKVVYRKSFDHERPYEREFRGIQKFEPVSRVHESQLDVLHVGRNDADGYFYYVMELADDERAGQEIDPNHYSPKSLKSELLRRGRLPFNESIELAVKLTTALEHLHQQGLVHRDIKPSNIIFVNGSPKLADIGLVTAQDETMSFVSTIGYFPPEGPGTPAADLYSLGKVLYEASTGKDRQEFPDPPTELSADADAAAQAELNEIVLKACARDARERYQTAREMKADLLLLQSGRSVKRLRTMERRLARLRKAGVLAAIAGLLGAAGYFYQQRLANMMRELAEQSRQRLVRLHVANSLHLQENGDFLASLVGLVEALKLARTPAEEDLQRRRIAAVLRSSPTLVQMGAHERAINHAQFSADGKWLLTASDDHTACMWDVATGAPRARLTGHTAPITHTSFSPDCRKVVTASDDGTARVWDAASGEPLVEPLRHEGPVFYAWFDPQGRRIVTASADGTARVWDAQRGLPAFDALRHQDRVNFACFSPDGRLVLTASKDRTARLWDASTGEPNGPALVHPQEVSYAALSPDSRLVATGCRDGAVRVWEPANGQPIIPPLQHIGKVRYLCFSPGGERLLVAAGEHGVNGEARVWNLASGSPLTPPLRHALHVSHAAFSPDGRWVATASSDQTAKVWDAFTGQPLMPVLKHQMPVWFVEFTPDGRHLLTVGRDRLWRLWDLATEANATEWEGCSLSHKSFTEASWRTLTNYFAARRFSREPGEPRWLAISSDGRWMLMTVERGAAFVWDVEREIVVSKPMDHADGVAFAEFSADARWILTSGFDGAIRVWATATWQPIAPPLRHRFPAHTATFSPDGTRIAVAARETNPFSSGEAGLWTAVKGELAVPVLEHPSAVSDVAFSPDGRLLATAYGNATTESHAARLWDVATGHAVGLPMNHAAAAGCVAFSPDGHWVATGGSDAVARIWSVATGKPVGRPLRHRQGVEGVAFSPDGALLATGSKDGMLRVWERATGELVCPPAWQGALISGVVFSPDGNWLLVKRGDWYSRALAIRADLHPVGLLENIASVEAGVRMDEAGGIEPLSAEEVLTLFRRLVKDRVATSPSDAEITLKWHRFQAQASEMAANWFAAQFHLNRLVALEPDDRSLIRRRDYAVSAWEASRRNRGHSSAGRDGQ